MRLTILPRGLFILSLLTACVNNQSSVNVTVTPSDSSSLSTETAIPATQLSDTPREVNSFTGRIVYSTEGDVYVINADGSERRRLTDNPAEDFDPVWSTDGTQIAFRSHRDGNEECM